MQVAICDEVPGRPRDPVMALTLDRPVISLRDLIRARIALELEQLAEVETDPQDAEERLRKMQRRFLVVPDSVERQLNGERGPYGPGTRLFPGENREAGDAAPADAGRMAELAFAAFASGGFFVLTGERQILDLDEDLSFAETGDITFLKITPLQGG
ncbi:hypothetical protein Q9Q95_01100 [Sphingomonas sp. DG1-23]|uniref:hypothetical protein n=1 Tax=Sphingomonas sp. DG1-23 TaxID=3068316 RepID=UPI00273FFD98|nr:hypothetical protein [Sphingomonas sp. DG1-23]MDP5277504.1 hypothetical protein [Sphingomonas sp. DG1-23]